MNGGVAVGSDTMAAADALAARVREVLAGVNGHTDLRLVQLVVPMEEKPDTLAWLRAQPDALGPKGFWADRAGDETVVFCGVADVLADTRPEAFRGALTERLAAGVGDVRYYGGMRFDADAPADAVWAPLDAFRFVLPRFELRVGTEGARLLCHLKLPRDASRAEEVLALIDRLTPPASHDTLSALPRLVCRVDRPGRDGWEQTVTEALAAIRGGQLEKVVLARKTAFSFDAALDPMALLARLQAATHDCFHFLFKLEEGPVFLGASPERLLRIEGRQIWSEALAGTRPRGASPSADARLQRELIEDPKERREHALVARSIRERLAALCTSVEGDAALRVLRLSRSQHLCTRLRGRLRPGVSVVEALRALHPTPAVGGTPSKAAHRAIRRWEPFDRGWYAGPVGWIGPDAAELAVGIRSGLVHDRTLDLFSGAGIVEGSVPEREWDEIEQKIGNFLGVTHNP